MRHPIFIVLLVDFIALAAAVATYMITGEVKLGESGFLTRVSAAQLLGISWLSFRIFRIRNAGIGTVFSLKNPRIIWALIAAGFFFLTADELFKIHESIDALIHSVFGLTETGITDRIDDLLVFLYALIGLGVIAAYRKEFVLMKNALPFFLWGFGLLFLMVGLDVVTNRPDILRSLFERDLADSLKTWLSFAEEGAKVFSSGFFVIAFHKGLLEAKKSGAASL